jgi:hypothetical protein
MWQRNVAVGLVLLSLGCTTLQPVEAPVPFLAVNRPPAILITGPDGQDIELAGPRLQSDSLVGLYENEPFKISMLEVKGMRAKQVDKQRTILFAGAMALGTAAVVAGISIAAGRHNVPLDTSYKCPLQLCSVNANRAARITIRVPFLVPLR